MQFCSKFVGLSIRRFHQKIRYFGFLYIFFHPKKGEMNQDFSLIIYPMVFFKSFSCSRCSVPVTWLSVEISQILTISDERSLLFLEANQMFFRWAFSLELKIPQSPFENFSTEQYPFRSEYFIRRLLSAGRLSVLMHLASFLSQQHRKNCSSANI